MSTSTTGAAEPFIQSERRGHHALSSVRALVIDDDPDIHALVAAMLRPLHVSVTSATGGDEGLAMARRELPDVILLDFDMPGASGLDVLQALRRDPVLASVPVIMVTGSDSHKVLTKCFDAGAADFIRKPFFGEELRARVSSELERQSMLAQLGRAAHLDTLTGLPNRSLLQARLNHSIERAATSPSNAFAVMFIDFDRFKLINDSLGHDIGDLLLIEIAARLRHSLRATDSIARDRVGTTVARLGGDEFVIILEGVGTPDAAAAIADRLLGVLEQPYQLQTHVVRSSASIGIVHSGIEYTTADDMLRDADIAMYQAKSRGKACYVQFSSEMRDAVRERLRIETALREAIDTDQIQVVYQPIVSLQDRILESVEVLVRWHHPTMGLIAPSDFIPIAEETRMILPLSDQILRIACRQFVEWQERAPAFVPKYISVNISRIQLADPDIVPRTLRILHESGINPRCVQLEVTESQIMQNREFASEQLTAFKAAGLRLAMDDFGSGYSSLSCLQEYPFDVLKIDRSLAENISRPGGYSALLHAIVTLADNLGLSVVAEGVETFEQVVLLQALGSYAGQGYFLAPPMSAADLEVWWSRHPDRSSRAA